VLRTAHKMGIETVLGVSEADAASLPARLAGRAVVLGPGPSAQSYLAIDRVVAAARETGCDAVHPGYGFLSENAAFARAVAAAGWSSSARR
jgi:acetyl-CoA carboxylase biotin carboxylase subunit